MIDHTLCIWNAGLVRSRWDSKYARYNARNTRISGAFQIGSMLDTRKEHILNSPFKIIFPQFMKKL